MIDSTELYTLVLFVMTLIFTQKSEVNKKRTNLMLLEHLGLLNFIVLSWVAGLLFKGERHFVDLVRRKDREKLMFDLCSEVNEPMFTEHYGSQYTHLFDTICITLSFILCYSCMKQSDFLWCQLCMGGLIIVWQIVFLLIHMSDIWIDLCTELCLPSWLAVVHGKNFNVGHYMKIYQPNFSIPAMLILATIDF